MNPSTSDELSVLLSNTVWVSPSAGVPPNEPGNGSQRSSSCDVLTSSLLMPAGPTNRKVGINSAGRPRWKLSSRAKVMSATTFVDSKVTPHAWSNFSKFELLGGEPIGLLGC